MNTFARIAIAAFTMVGVATAQPKVHPKTPGKANAKADAEVDVKTKVDANADPRAAKETPRPPARLEAMGKAVAGTWKCTGTETGMDGATVKMTATVKAKVELDNWWIADTVDLKGKSTFKMFAFTTYDANSKKWRRVSIDNGGRQYVGTSDGMKDKKVDWHMDFIDSTGAGQVREHIDLTDPEKLKNWGEMSMDKGKTWNRVFEMTCKK